MRVIEGRQIATDTDRAVRFQTPQTVSVTKVATSEVTHPMEIKTTKAVARLTEVPVTKAVMHSVEIQTTVGINSQPQKLLTAHPEILPDNKPVPIHTESAEVKELQSIAKQIHPETAPQRVQSVPLQPHRLEVRSGQREMTLKELFTTGRKEEES